MKILSIAVSLAVALILASAAAQAQNYTPEELRLPMREAGSRGLEALLVRPDAPGKYPLVVISHGAPRKPEDRARMTPWTYYPVAIEFARRGFAAAVVMRRGYGDSGGTFAERSGSCEQPDYVRSAIVSAQDVRAAIAALAARPDIDGTRVLAVGQSAGGRGSKADFVICNEARLIAAFQTFGKTSRTPMLWVYTANDHYFEPALAAKFHAAFTAGGGKAQFMPAPAFGKDGHSLFSLVGIPQWTPYVDTYLAGQKIAQRDTPMALPPLPAVTPPPQLSRRGRETFETYLRAGQHKAFAITEDGGFGWQTGRRSVDEAKAEALKFCQGDKGRECRIVFIGDQPAP